jgi:hypothetical protein
MKKKLEADLISIVHRILQLKNKSDVNQLFLETQKLYEKLAVLRFVEEHFGEPKPTIGQAEVVEKMKEFFENIAVPEFQRPTASIKTAVKESLDDKITVEESIPTPEIVEIKNEEPKEQSEEVIATKDEIPTSITEEPVAELEELKEVIEEKTEEITPIEAPMFVLEKPEIEPIAKPIESEKSEIQKKKEAVQISFDDLLGGKYIDPDFVKVSPSEKKQQSDSSNSAPTFDFKKETVTTAEPTSFEKEEPKLASLNDKLAKEITIGLNDRIAFVKHLFGGNNEDYNRVLNQLITFDTFLETKTFIDEMVKPDYNNWEGKEEYELRFVEIIEKKFLSF